jgi:hypothetical protein
VITFAALCAVTLSVLTAERDCPPAPPSGH